MMRAAVLGAVVACAVGTGASAATVAEPGYTWTADDASLNLFVAADEGEDFSDLVAEEGGLQLAFLEMVNGNFLPEIRGNLIETETYYDDALSYEMVDGQECLIRSVGQIFTSLSFESGLLAAAGTYSVVDYNNPPCGREPEYYSSVDFTPGTWAAVGGAPAYSFGDVALIPLPASATLLSAALAGLGLASLFKKRAAARG